MAAYEDILKIYDALVDMTPGVERKGKTMPYTSDNGYMYSLLNKEAEIGLRLSKEDGEEFMDRFDSGEFRSHGAKMREYVRVPENLHAELKTLSSYLKKGQTYVKSLPPK